MYTQLQLRDSARPPVNVATLAPHEGGGREDRLASPATTRAMRRSWTRPDVDVVLVGDSLGMVIQGHDTTVPVTLEHIIYHCKAVAKGLIRPFLMADMPFMTYTSREQALQNAVRLMQEGGAKMVKLEGGAGQVEIVEFLASHDIAVCAHLGLRPQSVHKTGGFRVQGREDAAAEQMKRDAKALQDAGADIVLLECIPIAARRGDHAGAARAGDRHRRRAGHRRPDPRALRRARHHAGPQAALRARTSWPATKPARGAPGLRGRP